VVGLAVAVRFVFGLFSVFRVFNYWRFCFVALDLFCCVFFIFAKK